MIMSDVKCTNSAEFNTWAKELRRKGFEDLVSLKGKVYGETVNIAWQSIDTKEIFSLEYEQAHKEE